MLLEASLEGEEPLDEPLDDSSSDGDEEIDELEFEESDEEEGLSFRLSHEPNRRAALKESNKNIRLFFMPIILPFMSLQKKTNRCLKEQGF